MKILVVFIDMVRVDFLKLINSDRKKTLLDRNLERIGGTLYTRCFTPGPDTPRSNACMQTGLYPYFNGCDTRIKWPRYFIKDDITTIFDHAYSQGYTINACVRKRSLETGLFKYAPSTKINYFETYSDFFAKKEISDNTLNFVYDPDWHTAISDNFSTERSFNIGDNVVSKLFEKYLTEDYIELFDYVIIYSDHGFQTRSESDHMKSKLQLLDNGRNQILMLIHQKGNKEIVKDNRLASMLDLYATIEMLIGCSDFRHGFSLLDAPRREILHIEDHQDFKVYPEIMIKQWRIITEQFDVRTDAVNYTCGKDNEVYNRIHQYLKEYSPKYADYVKQLDVWKHYAELSNDRSACYVVGEKRRNKSLLLALKICLKTKSVIIRFFR